MPGQAGVVQFGDGALCAVARDQDDGVGVCGLGGGGSLLRLARREPRVRHDFQPGLFRRTGHGGGDVLAVAAFLVDHGQGLGAAVLGQLDEDGAWAMSAAEVRK